MAPRKQRRTAEQVVQAADELGRRRADLRAELDSVQSEIVELVQAARQADVPITRVADLVGISPPALYGLVARRNRRAGV